MLNVVLGRFPASEETELVSACFAPNNDSIVWFSQITWMGGVSFQKAFELFGPPDDDSCGHKKPSGPMEVYGTTTLTSAGFMVLRPLIWGHTQ